MTQKEMVLAHLKGGHCITPLEALSEYGCFRLADVIYRLKDDGHDIKTRLIRCPKTGKRFGEYHMTEKVNA